MQVEAYTNAQYDCEQYSSWSALGTMIGIIRETQTIDALDNGELSEFTEWKNRVKTKSSANGLVNAILESLN